MDGCQRIGPFVGPHWGFSRKPITWTTLHIFNLESLHDFRQKKKTSQSSGIWGYARSVVATQEPLKSQTFHFIVHALFHLVFHDDGKNRASRHPNAQSPASTLNPTIEGLGSRVWGLGFTEPQTLNSRITAALPCCSPCWLCARIAGRDTYSRPCAIPNSIGV